MGANFLVKNHIQRPEHRLSIGETVRIGRTDYLIVAEFTDVHPAYIRETNVDNGAIKIKEGLTEELMYVGRKSFANEPMRFEYAHIITWFEDEQKWLLRS